MLERIRIIRERLKTIDRLQVAGSGSSAPVGANESRYAGIACLDFSRLGYGRLVTELVGKCAFGNRSMFVGTVNKLL